MQTKQYQLTLYLPDDENQQAVAAPKDDTPPPKALSIREAAHLYTCKIKILDTRSRILAIETLYRGNLNSASVRVGEVFKGAIRRNAVAILLCHNHPSNDPSPSPDDVQVTRMIVEAGKLLAIDVLDHLVLSKQRFVSLRERGLGFN